MKILSTLISTALAIGSVIGGVTFAQDTLAAGSSAVVPAKNLKWHRIEIGYCGFWDRPHTLTLVFSYGYSLQVKCTGHNLISRMIHPGFQLTVLDQRKRRFEVGHCIFEAGCNLAYYLTPESNPKKLVGTVWRNFDGGTNDPRRRIDHMEFTGPQEPFLDWVDWKFDVASHSLTWTAYKYRYLEVPAKHKYDPRCQYMLGNIGPRLDSATKSRTVYLLPLR